MLRKILKEIPYWIVMIIISALVGMAVLEFHIQHEDLYANICVFAAIILLLAFLREIVRRELRAAFTHNPKQSNKKEGPAGSP